MSFHPEQLLAFDIPEVTQSLSPREHALYALAIGCGQDPGDPQDRAFCGAAGPVVPLPGIVTVLGHPGFWQARPELGIDALRLVHGEQTLEIHAPLPLEGEIRAKTRITGLVDKGKDKGAVLYSQREIRAADSGVLLATTRSATFLRGNGGFGGSFGEALPPLAAPIPARAPDQQVALQSRPEQALFYRWMGDHNPLHFDPDVAARAGFDRPILHGLCSYGMAARGLLRAHPGRSLRHMRGRFSAVVFPGEAMTLDLWAGGHFRLRVPARDKVVIDQGFAELV